MTRRDFFKAKNTSLEIISIQNFPQERGKTRSIFLVANLGRKVAAGNLPLFSLQGRETETCVNCLQGPLAPSFPERSISGRGSLLQHFISRTWKPWYFLFLFNRSKIAELKRRICQFIFFKFVDFDFILIVFLLIFVFNPKSPLLANLWNLNVPN